MVLGKRSTRTRKTSSASPSRKKQKTDDPSSWTVVILKEWLSDRDLSTSGRKADLVERVKEEMENNPSSSKTKNESEEEEKEECEYGAECYRKNPDHLKKYSHPDKKEESEEEEEQPKKKRPTREKKKNPLAAWKSHGSILYYNPPESNDSEKIAAFDMDSTLIEPKSGKTFAQGRNDWRWLFPCVPKKLAELHKDGYKVVIISNQNGIAKGKTSPETVEGKILDLEEECGVPLAAILATADDDFRKPSPNMFTFCIENMITKEVNLAESFYIGDAAGRPKDWAPGRKKDFGCSDRKFGHNAGIDFKTPEEFFLSEKPAPFDWLSFDPKSVKTKSIPDSKEFISDEQEVILFVGFPASGKSTFAKTHLIPNGYVHVNRDTLGTMAKCKNAMKEALSNGKSVVIDNTNPSPSAREPFITIAENAGVPIRCFHFQTSLELAKHLNNFREVITKGEMRHVPMVGYNMFKKHFVKPSKSEGFSSIKEIEFQRNHPDDEHKEQFDHWTERLR